MEQMAVSDANGQKLFEESPAEASDWKMPASQFETRVLSESANDTYERKRIARKVIAATAPKIVVAKVNGRHHRGIQNSFPVRLVTRIFPARIVGL